MITFKSETNSEPLMIALYHKDLSSRRQTENLSGGQTPGQENYPSQAN